MSRRWPSAPGILRLVPSRPAALLAGTLAVVAAGAAGCGRAPAPRPGTPVVLAVAALPHAALVHLALEHGDFAAEGLEVTVRTYPYGQLALGALLEGDADLATVADTPLAFAILRGRRAVALATIASSTRGNALIVRRDGGIATARDLRGRRVGLPRGTSSEFFLDSALVRAEVPPADVALVDVKPAEMEQALRSRTVDAVAAFPPYVAALARALAPDAVVLQDTVSYDTFNVVASQPLADRADVAERVVRALLRAEARARAEPGPSQRTVAARLGVPPAEIASAWSSFELSVRLEQSLVVLLEQEARWAIRAGLVPAQPTPDFRAAIAPAPLRAARASAVRLMW